MNADGTAASGSSWFKIDTKLVCRLAMPMVYMEALYSSGMLDTSSRSAHAIVGHVVLDQRKQSWRNSNISSPRTKIGHILSMQLFCICSLCLMVHNVICKRWAQSDSPSEACRTSRRVLGMLQPGEDMSIYFLKG